MRIYEILKGLPEPANDNVNAFPTRPVPPIDFDYSGHPSMVIPWAPIEGGKKGYESDGVWPRVNFDEYPIVSQHMDLPDPRFNKHGGVANDNPRLRFVHK